MLLKRRLKAPMRLKIHTSKPLNSKILILYIRKLWLYHFILVNHENEQRKLKINMSRLDWLIWVYLSKQSMESPTSPQSWFGWALYMSHTYYYLFVFVFLLVLILLYYSFYLSLNQDKNSNLIFSYALTIPEFHLMNQVKVGRS